LEIQADFANAHQQRGNVLRLMGRREEAVVAYQQAIALGADVTQLNFSLASLGEGQTPEAAPHNYVKELFDRYAPHFDAHLEQRLAYQVPALMKHALEQVLQPSGALMPCMDRVLDLGCGTGLCGDFLRPWTKHLSGVDLSENMLDQARMKGQYDDLQCADIHDYLETENDPVQLVLAADVLVYIGRLDRLFKLAHDRLADGGLFAFTVELNEDEGESEKRPGDYVLLGSQRYAHSEAYLRRLSQQTHDLDWKVDWKIEKLEMHIARHDHGKAIEIALGIFRKI
jgi:predicted TPR repeat methyltransferase